MHHTTLERTNRWEVHTRTGSRYVVIGDTVRKLHADGREARFDLIGVRNGRLSYTDGDRVFISSPIVPAATTA